MSLSDGFRFAIGFSERPDEQELLAAIARQRGCSEYDLFLESGNQWNLPVERIRGDFAAYLRDQRIPPYVRSEIRNADYVHDPHGDIRLALDYAGRLVRKVIPRLRR